MSMVKIVMAGVLLAVGLSACGCPPFIPRVVGCYDVTDLKMAPMALRFQKRGQWGHTDYNQRKEDMIECGVLREKYYDSLAYIWGVEPGETIQQMRDRKAKFLQCIKAKDYQWLGLEECGPVKENRGICK
jgi:hypothetical protein